MENIYDVIIIGGGPGGYTAALYAGRAGLKTLVLEKLVAGGQMSQTSQIDNYPGFDQGIDGLELGERMEAGALRFGAESELAEVYSVQLKGDIKKIESSEGDFYARTVIIATGAGHRPLGVEQEDKYVGKGIAYCATCDGAFYKDKTVGIVGGGNSAVTDALLLARICKKVILIHRRDSLRASQVYFDQLKNTANIEFRWNQTVNRLLAADRLNGVELKDVNSGELSTLELDGLFVSVGRNPASGLFRDQLELDPSGYIIADESTRTNLPGVFAIGDVRTKAVRQVITAAADGAVAAHYAEEYLAAHK